MRDLTPGQRVATYARDQRAEADRLREGERLMVDLQNAAVARADKAEAELTALRERVEGVLRDASSNISVPGWLLNDLDAALNPDTQEDG